MWKYCIKNVARPGVGGATTIQARNCPLLLPINPHTLLLCSSALLLCTAFICSPTLPSPNVHYFGLFCYFALRSTELRSAALFFSALLIPNTLLYSTILDSVHVCSNLPIAGETDSCNALNLFKIIKVLLSIFSTWSSRVVSIVMFRKVQLKRHLKS